MGGTTAISSLGAEVAEDTSTLGGKISAMIAKIAAKLGTSTKGLIAGAETTVGAAQGLMTAGQGGMAIYVAVLQSEMTRILGGMKSSEELSSLIKQAMDQINAVLKAYSDEYSALLNNIKNIGMYGHSEVDAMLKANQSA